MEVNQFRSSILCQAQLTKPNLTRSQELPFTPGEKIHGKTDCYTVVSLIKKSVNVWEAPTQYKIKNQDEKCFILHTFPLRELGVYLKKELLTEEISLERLKDEKFNVQHIVEKIDTQEHHLIVKTFANAGTLSDFIQSRRIS